MYLPVDVDDEVAAREPQIESGHQSDQRSPPDLQSLHGLWRIWFDLGRDPAVLSAAAHRPRECETSPINPDLSLDRYTRFAYVQVVSGFHLEIEWDPLKGDANMRKHGVSFTLALSVWRDPLAVTTFDEAHSETEERWITIGRAITGECLTVVHT